MSILASTDIFMLRLALSKCFEGSKHATHSGCSPPLQHNCCLLLPQSCPCEPTPPSSLHHKRRLHMLLKAAVLDGASPAALYGSGRCVPARQLPPLQVSTRMALQDGSSLHAPGSPRLQHVAHSCLQPACPPAHKVECSILF